MPGQASRTLPFGTTRSMLRPITRWMRPTCCWVSSNAAVHSRSARRTRRQEQVILPNGIFGVYYVLLRTDARSQITETNAENNNLAAAASTVSLAPYADLMVSSLVSTADIVVGNPAQIDVSWTVTNQGTGAGTVETWQDRIVVSSNAVYGDSDDRLVASFGHSGALSAGGTYSRSERVALPTGLSGQYHLFVATDSAGAVYEYTFENNNVTKSETLLSVRPAEFADLVVSSVVAPNSGSSGEPLAISWTVTNQRAGVTNVSSWQDRIVLSSDTTIGNADDVTLGTYAHSGALVGGANYSQSADVILPNGTEGTRYLFVVTDVTGSVDEFILENNNTGRSDAIAVSLTPPPDLQVTSITPPAQVLSKGSLVVTWTVSNSGTGRAAEVWTDRIYLSADAIAGGDQLLGTFVYSGGLDPGASYSRTETLALPELADGNYYIVVSTDSANVVYEHVAEGNNTSVSSNPVAVRHPDLQISALSVPAESVSGTNVLVAWTVTNKGTGVTHTGQWYDTIYGSSDATLDAADTLLGEFARNGVLEVNASYSQQQQVLLPNGIFGTYYLIVRTDARNEITETSAENNNLAAASSTVSLAPYADLTVTSVASTSEIVIGNPAHIDVSWTVANQGTGSGAVDTWTDRIVVSANAIYGDADDRLVANVTHTGLLAVGSQYSRTERVDLPVALAGQYHLLVATDAANAVYEFTKENNNVTESPSLVSVRPTGFADLVVLSVLAPDTGMSGQSLNLSWTVANQGTGTTSVGAWKDRVVLSADGQLGNQDDVTLGTFTRTGSLAPGRGYVRSGAVVLPNGTNGDYYLFVVADAENAVDEFILDSNNAAHNRPGDHQPHAATRFAGVDN